MEPDPVYRTLTDVGVTATGLTEQELWHGPDAQRALGTVYDRYADRVYGHCLRQLGSTHDAEDATASVFLEAWRRRNDLRFVNGSLLPWLLVTATNVCRNLRRSRRRFHEALARLPAPDIQPDIAEDAAHAADVASERQRVEHAFRSLRPSAQMVLTLCDIEGLTYEQASELLEVPVGTVRSRLSRGRAQLRQLLDVADDSPHSPRTPARWRRQ